VLGISVVQDCDGVAIGHIDDLAQQGIGLYLKHQAQRQGSDHRFEFDDVFKMGIYSARGIQRSFLSTHAPDFLPPGPAPASRTAHRTAFVRTRISAPPASFLTDKLVEMLKSRMELEKLSVICSFCSFAIR